MTIDDQTHADLRLQLHWETALDRLELDVILTERVLADPTRPLPEPWDEPQLFGPIPETLQQRAREISARQQRVQAQLATRVAIVSQQHDFASRVEQATRRPDVPVYLDLQA